METYNNRYIQNEGGHGMNTNSRTSTPNIANYQSSAYSSLQSRNFDYSNFPPEKPPYLEDDGTTTTTALTTLSPRSRRRETRSGSTTTSIPGDLTPPNFYYNYNYSNSNIPPPSSQEALNIRNNSRFGANQPNAAVIRQLRDKFQVIDNTRGSSVSVSVASEGSIIPRGGSEYRESSGVDKTLPSYGSLIPPPLVAPRRNSDSSGTQEGTGLPWLNWFQGRLPLLILIILCLLCLFLALSGALVYFKYVPSSTKLNHLTTKDEPCESTQCAFGAVCRVEGGRATCRCPESCAPDYSPVCGYDEVTYGNECLLRKYMCQSQKIVQIRHVGECNEPDPCEDKACLYGSVCVPSTNGLYASCECLSTCPNYGDSLDSRSVCGSDGKVHKTKCDLDRLACRLGRTISVKYAGKCNPCAGITCPPPQICQLDEARRPSCHCGDVCSSDFLPICASDGRTYSNECMLRQEACRSRRDLRIIYRGKCSSGVNPCESRTCRGYETCAINRFGIAQCTCAMICDPVISPVCGDDGKTYDNECQLTLNSCRDSRLITVAYRGVCDVGSACRHHNCTPGATCSERNGEPICECPVCPSDYDPVCGTNSVSYQNLCHLQFEACTALVPNQSGIQVLHPGLCNGCEKLRCEFHSTCVLEGDGASCECPTECSSLASLTTGNVCGDDGQTYSNECELQKSSCREQRLITVASKGSCDECTNVHCKFGAKCESGVCVCPTECPSSLQPVCSSNLVTYPNECEMQRNACRLGRQLSVHFYGDCSEGLGPFAASGSGSGGQDGGLTIIEAKPPASSVQSPITPFRSNQCDSIRCDFDALCELGEDGFPRCSCQFNCSAVRGNPICGSDLKLYPNDCEMQKAACLSQTELRPRPMELCEDIEIKPCYGEEPLKHEDTGLDMNCANGPTRVNCPSGSFCHRTSSFAKCCRKYQESFRGTTTTTSTTASPPPKPISEGDSAGEMLSCLDSAHGCCLDELTAAEGDNYEGCPPLCSCNKLGSVRGGKCEPVTQTCSCRAGVGGEMCDRCLPGFWGLSRISLQQGNEGCIPCSCSKFGSVREDCEQMTGRCVCKPGVLGHKCDSCAEGEFLGPLGCSIDSTNVVRTCDEVECEFGAMCEQDGNRAGCACNILCDSRFDVDEVCGSDHFTYQSECHVQLQSCRSQTAIWVNNKGPCLDTSEGSSSRKTETESSVPRKWTAFTEPGDDSMLELDMRNDTEVGRVGSGGGFGGSWKDQTDVGGSSAMKSTRHLPSISQFHPNNFYKRVPGHRFPTSTTIQIRSYLGEMCQGDSECVTGRSTCRSGRCVCREGFYEDVERIQCKPVHSHLPGTTTCSKTLCDATAVCFDYLNGSYTCACPLTTSNSGGIGGCFEKEPPVPFFTGKSRIVLGKLAGYHKLSIEVEISPYLDFAHGLIIFSSQHADGTGDFMSLALVDGYVEFRYDLGDGPLILKSPGRVTSGSTYSIVAKRYNRDGLLRINEEEDIVGTSPGTMKSLNLENGGYIGHVPLNSTKVWELVGTSNGFIGCLHKLKVGRRQIEFLEGKDPLIRSIQQVYQCPMKTLSPPPAKKLQPSYIVNTAAGTTTPLYIVDNYVPEEEEETNQIIPILMTTSPSTTTTTTTTTSSESFNLSGTSLKIKCSRKMCRHHGECWVDESAKLGYKCVCPPSYSGKICEKHESRIAESGAVLDFRGFSYLELPRIETGARHLTIELWLMVRSRNGILFYSGQEKGKGDCVALLLSNGYVQFLFDLGSGMANLTWDKPLTLNKWHWIIASRVGREGKIQVDGEIPQTIKSPPALSELNLELPTFIGGIRDINLLHRDLGIPRAFDGVLQYLRINGETYHREVGDALRRRLVHRNEGPPCGASISPPCRNGGSCYPRLDSFACACMSQFTGKACEIRKSVAGPVRFDGQNFLKFPRKIGKHELLNLFDYDDFSNENFDSDLDELFVGFGSGANAEEESDSEIYDDYGKYDIIESNISSNEELAQRGKAQRRNRLEIVFRTSSQTSGVIFWTGQDYHHGAPRRGGFLGLFISDGKLELRIDLGAPKTKKPVMLRSKMNVTDGRWHQVLVARRRRLIVFQVDGSTPLRATAPVGSNVLFSDGKIWIGGVGPSIMHTELPPTYHQGFIGCIDLVRIEKRPLPLSKVALDNGFASCEDDD